MTPSSRFTRRRLLSFLNRIRIPPSMSNPEEPNLVLAPIGVRIRIEEILHRAIQHAVERTESTRSSGGGSDT